MPWTTPRTWVAKEKITAALLNTHLRDNLDYLNTAVGSVPTIYTGAHVGINNSTTETTLFSQSLNAGAMGANGVIHLMGNFSTNVSDATSRTVTLRIKLGSTTIFAPAPNVAVNTAGRTSAFWRASIANINNAAVQLTTLHIFTFVPTGATVLTASQTAAGATTNTVPLVYINTSTENTANAATLAVTAQLSAASANYTLDSHGVTAQVIYSA